MQAAIDGESYLTPNEFEGIEPELVWLELKKLSNSTNKLVAISHAKKSWSVLTPNVRRLCVKHMCGMSSISLESDRIRN